MSFLYYRAQQTRNVTTKDVTAWGLTYAFENNPLTCVCHNNTPTGSAGVVFADAARVGEARVKMDMENQVWKKMPRPGQPDVYVGYWKDARPTPEKLARRQMLNGFTLTMRDKSQWRVPLVRFLDKGSDSLVSGLPTSVGLDDNGEFAAGDVVEEYAYLYELMGKYAANMQAGTLVDLFESLSMKDLCSDAKRLLQANYVVDAAEISQLKLWQVSRDECVEANAIILAAIDYQNYHDWEEASKKKTPSLVAVAG